MKLHVLLAIMVLFSFSTFAKTVTAGSGKVSFWVPDGWQKQAKGEMWLDTATRSSANIQVEASNMKMGAYLDLSLKNMKKGIPSYKVISKEIKTINGKKAGILLGKMNMYNNDLTLYSVVIDISGTKYVLTAGGLTGKFNANRSTFDKIVASFKVTGNTSTAKTTTINYKGGQKAVIKKVSFWVPSNWTKKSEKMWWNATTGSSANIQTEATSMELSAYLDLSLKNMKKGIPSYKLISKEIKTINGKKAGVLLGKMNMYNNDLTLYSVVIDISGTKYVLTTGGLTGKFNANRSTFDKVVSTLKVEK